MQHVAQLQLYSYTTTTIMYILFAILILQQPNQPIRIVCFTNITFQKLKQNRDRQTVGWMDRQTNIHSEEEVLLNEKLSFLSFGF